MKEEDFIDVEVSFQPDRADLATFWKYYEMEQKFHASESKWKQVIWGNPRKSERVCRFCKKDASATTFRNLAHLVPALLGNKVLFSGFECDECNSIFSRYENELANFSGVWHTLSQVQGRGRISKFKDAKKGFHLVSQNNQLHLYIEDLKKGGINFNPEKETLEISTFKPAFVPRDALKCLIKIAFGFLEEKSLSDYDKTRRWLIGEIRDDDVPMHPYFYVPRARNTKRFNDPLIMLMRRRQLEAPFAIPEHSLLLWYGVFIYQIYIPFHKNEDSEFAKGKLFIPIEEHLCEEIASDNPLGAANVNIMNMGAKVRVKGVDENIVLPFVRNG